MHVKPCGSAAYDHLCLDLPWSIGRCHLFGQIKVAQQSHGWALYIFVPSRAEKNSLSMYHGEPCEMSVKKSWSMKWQFFTAGTTLLRKVWVDGPMEFLDIFSPLKSCHSKFSMHTGWSAASTWRSCSNWKMTWRMTWTQWGYSLSAVGCYDIGALHNFAIFFCNQSSSLCWIQLFCSEVNVVLVKLDDWELASGFAVSAAISPVCLGMFQRLWGPWSDDEEREQAEFCAPGGFFLQF